MISISDNRLFVEPGGDDLHPAVLTHPQSVGTGLAVGLAELQFVLALLGPTFLTLLHFLDLLALQQFVHTHFLVVLAHFLVCSRCHHVDLLAFLTHHYSST